MLPTSPSSPSIVTGLATSGNTSNWAMKLTSVDGTYKPTIESDTNGSFTNYHIIPDKYTKIATLTSSTDFTIGSSFKSTYRVFVSQNQMADTYTGKVKYTLVHPNDADPPLQPHAATPKCISYWPNASGVVDSMGDDCGGSSTGSGYGNNANVAALWASNFRRDGYGFVGWSDKFDWVLNENDANGNGTGPNEGYHVYGPNATITTPPDMTEKGLSLYAIWIPAGGTLQSFTTSQCNAMNIGEVTALKDARDHNAYAVAKLKDGNCWMIENLRLDHEDSIGVENEALAQGYAKSTTYGDFIGLAEPETASFDTSRTANSLYYSGTQSGTASIDIGTSNYPYNRFPRFNNQNTSSAATQMTGTDGNTYSYGNWYNWPAAIADTSSYYYGDGQSITSTSICPAGWRLPQGSGRANSSKNDFRKLSVDTIGYGTNGSDGTGSGRYDNNDGSTKGTEASNKLRSYPNNFIYSGQFISNQAYYQGSNGIYWSSTVYYYNGSNNGSYSFSLGSHGVFPGTAGGAKFFGKAIRCVQ